MSLTRKKQNKPDSSVCIIFSPLNLVIILHGAERKPSVAGESVSTRQLSKPLRKQGQCRRAASPAEASALWLVRSRYRHSTTNTQTRQSHANAHACMGGFITMATGDWLLELCRERILMTEERQCQRMESYGTVGEKTANIRPEVHANMANASKEPTCRMICLWPHCHLAGRSSSCMLSYKLQIVWMFI